MSDSHDVFENSTYWGTGQLGYELKSTLSKLGDVWAPPRDEFDLSNPESLRAKIAAFQPDLIVNPAAYTAVDKAESEQKEAQKINGESPKIIAEEANKLNIPLVHYSTDYVFDGDKSVPYTEKDEPRPSMYMVKLNLWEKDMYNSHMIAI